MPWDLATRVANRFAEEALGSPSEMAKVLEQALHPIFGNAYLKIEVGRGIAIEAGRMDPDAFAKFQISRAYQDTGINPRARVMILPNSSWGNLTVKSGLGGEAEKELKEAGVLPIRSASKLTPEKAYKLVLDWFTKNQSKLKGA